MRVPTLPFPAIVPPLLFGLDATLIGGCAATQRGAQYVDPQTPKQALQEAAVLIVCEAPEAAMRLICEREVRAELSRLGAKPRTDPQLVGLMSDREPSPEQYLPAAKAAGAAAAFTATFRPDCWQFSPMSAISFGVGGWSGSGGSSGVGVSMPVGGSQAPPGLAASGSLVEVASGRVVWSAGATTAQRGDASAQIAELARALAEAMGRAGLL